MASKSAYYFSNYWWTTKKGYPAAGIPNITWNANYATGVEVNIREAASAAVVCAIVANWNGYLNAAGGGVNLTLSDTRLRAAKLVAGVSNKHLNTAAGGWGRTWQSGYWAYLAGLAGWLVWTSALTNQTDRDRIAAVVEYEANIQLNQHRPEFYKNASTGAVLNVSGFYSDGPQGARTGDSAVEENVWNSTILDFAATMMPGHPNAAAWRRRAAQYALTGMFTATDALSTTTVVNGHSLNDWALGTGLAFPVNPPQAGYNLESNYSVINHGIRHPDYAQATSGALMCSIHNGLANRATPEAFRFNAERAYGAMRTVIYSGHAMYDSTASAVLYYPDGSTWGTSRYAGFWAWDSMIETQVLGAGNTSALVPVSATTWDGLHGNAAKAMQDRSGVMPGGQIVLNDAEDSYPGREGWHSFHAAMIVLNKILTNASRISWTNSLL